MRTLSPNSGKTKVIEHLLTTEIMPNIGEIQRASSLGYTGRSLRIWDACPGCGKARWQYLSQKGTLCHSCAAQRRSRKTTPITFTGEGTPVIGDTAVARSLGYTDRGVRIFVACPVCHNPRWVRRSGVNTVCTHCASSIRITTRKYNTTSKCVKRGYTLVRIEADNPYRSMADRNGWVLEHRLVVAQRINRALTSHEVVHHINGNKSDNQDSNLQLLTERTHNSHLVVKDLQNRIQSLESRVLRLEAENALLSSQLNSHVNPEPSRRDISPGVCRDLTENTLIG